jgi:plastocyanin
MAWKNTDSVTHHIVMNDGSKDTGDIPPGGTSAALTLATNGGNYHCTIHPGMVGSINSSTGAPPPCSGAYCDSSK